MELNKLRENLASQVPLLVPENYMKPYNMKDEFSFEASSSSKGNYNYLQDFHHLDYQFHVTASSSNPIFAVQTPGFDPYNDSAYSAYEGSNADVNFYECKPLLNVDHQSNGGHGQVLDNFQNNNFVNGSGYLNFPAHRSNPFDQIMGSSSRRGQTNFLPLDCQDIKPMNFLVPDEVSCINNAADQNGYYKKFGFNGKSRLSTVTRASSYKGRKKSNVVKGQWTIEEDGLLIQLVEQYGVRKWSHIAQMLPGRIGKQCRERWHNHLRPDIKKDTWSEEEDKILIQSHAEIGNKWAEIAKRLPGRTENSIKNHWNATKRRQYSKRKCRSKYPRGSLLQEYIKSLNLDSPSNTTGRQRKNNNNNNVVTTTTDNIDSSNKAGTNVGFSCVNDRLVPNYDFTEDPDFCFDENMFAEGCSIDSLLDDIPYAPGVDEKSGDYDGTMVFGDNGNVDNKEDFEGKMMVGLEAGEEKDLEMEMEMEMEMEGEVVGAVMESGEVKKEMDLVEMISHVK